MASITALIMCSPSGSSAIEQQMAAARRRAAGDACLALASLADVAQIIIAAPGEELAPMALPESGKIVWDVDPPGQAFHFGERLAGIVRRHQLNRVLYLGAGSMPLLPQADLASVVSALAGAGEQTAITNNVHSADWVGLSSANVIAEVAHRLERDNMLAWVLREEKDFSVTSLAPTAGTRLDIDTPFDLQVLALHPRTRPDLRQFLAGLTPELNLERLQLAVQILGAPGSRVTMIGRVSASAWSMLESKSRCWTRVFSEERGMAANRRQATGQVFSLIADHIDRAGEKEFVAQLARTSDLVLFDTRVYLAHCQVWPSAADRFASDLGRPDLITDDRLRRLTETAVSAPVPIILGGHNVVSGGLYALLEIAEGG
jgi:CTP:molybdopterin cytidylyltransferase MocA